MAFRTDIYEAVDPAFTIANRIMNKMNWTEIADIAEHQEMNKEYIKRRAAKYCHSFDSLPEEVQNKVVERIWNRLKKNATTEDTKPTNREELKQKIVDYFNNNNILQVSIEDVAEDLASIASGEELTISEKDMSLTGGDFRKAALTALSGAMLGPIGLLASKGLLDSPKGLKWLKGKKIKGKK